MRICLIGATHPCHNPRLVREADSLAERSYKVRVVALRTTPGLLADDGRLQATRHWRLQTASIMRSPWPNRLRSLPARLRRGVAEEIFRRRGSVSAAEIALCEAAPQLLRLAVSEPADWFIAHAQPVLATAAHAARASGRRGSASTARTCWT